MGIYTPKAKVLRKTMRIPKVDYLADSRQSEVLTIRLMTGEERDIQTYIL
jgi:hypothetical protein